MAKAKAKAKANANGAKEKVNFFAGHEGEGYENLTAADYAVPFLRVLQLLSPQVNKHGPDYVEGAEPGMFFNTVTERLYGTKVSLIPLTFQKVWLEWLPDRGGLVGRHEPYSIKIDKSDFSTWRVAGGTNIVSECLLYYCLVVGHIEDGPVVFSLFSSGIKHGKNWNTQIMLTQLPNGKKAPYFSSVWELKTALNKNQQGEWFQIGEKKSAIVRKRFVTEKEFNDYVLPGKEALASIRELNLAELEDKVDTGQDVPY